MGPKVQACTSPGDLASRQRHPRRSSPWQARLLHLRASAPGCFLPALLRAAFSSGPSGPSSKITFSKRPSPTPLSETDCSPSCTLQLTALFYFLLFFLKKKKTFIYLFLEEGEGRERNINVQLPLTHPPPGTWLATQASALTGNQTGDPLVHRPVPHPLSHTSQGLFSS